MYLGHSFMKDFGSPLFILASLSSEKEATSLLLKIDKTEILLHFEGLLSQHETFIQNISTAQRDSTVSKLQMSFYISENHQISDKKSKIEFTFGGWGATTTIHRKHRLTNDP